MSRIEEMIRELCPEGVEYQYLGDTVEILDSRRKPVAKGKRNTGEYPYYGANGIQDYVDDYIFDGTFLLIGEDGSVIKKDNTPILNWATGKIWVNNHAHILREKIGVTNLRYIYFVLQTIDVSDIVRGTPPKLNQQNLRQISIPVPPLAIQNEIVNILDKFTELEAELEARRKQYEYYRNKLLNFNNFGGGYSDDVKWCKLGDIGVFIRGNGLQKKDFTEQGVGCIHYGQIYTYYHIFTDKTKSYISPELAKKLKKAKYGDIVIAATSENVEDVCKAVAWLGEDDIAISGDAYIFRHSQNPKYIAYFFSSESFQDQKKPFVTGTKVMRVSDRAMSKILIPIPPMEVQQRIVAILDKFEKLVNDISEGLPAEIAARRQQYEYYRDKLLCFD